MKASIFIVLLLETLAWSSVSWADQLKECEKPVDGLLKRIKPFWVELYLNVSNIQGDKYESQPTIHINVDEPKSEPANQIIVHADPTFEVKFVRYVEADTTIIKDIKVVDVCRNSAKQLLVITLAEDLRTNSQGFLCIIVEAKLRDDGKGLFKTTDDSGNPMVTANFEKSLARLVFPCFHDEGPDRIEFDLRMVHDRRLKATSSILGYAERYDYPKDKSVVVSIFKPLMETPLNKIDFDISKL